MRRALLLLTAGLAACSREEPLPVLGQVPDFMLTGDNGQTFPGRSLLGHVWVADFIFTNCNGPCPLMSSRMRRVQSATAAEPAIRLVSFTVDPERDTAETLHAYAHRFGAEPARWTFLTGDRVALQALSRDAFHLGDVDASLSHSTRFVLIDQSGRIRGYYGMGQEDVTRKIAADALRLAKERA